MNDAVPLLTIVLAGKAKEMKENDPNHHVVSEAPSAIMPQRPAVSKVAKRRFSELTTVEFLTEQSKHPLCRQLESPVGSPGSDYSYNWNGFLICDTPICESKREVVPRSLQVRLLHAYR